MILGIRIKTDEDQIDYLKFNIFIHILLNKNMNIEYSYYRIIKSIKDTHATLVKNELKQELKKHYEYLDNRIEHLNLNSDKINSFLNEVSNITIRGVRLFFIVLENLSEVKISRIGAERIYKERYKRPFNRFNAKDKTEIVFSYLCMLSDSIRLDKDSIYIESNTKKTISTDRLNIEVDKFKYLELSFLSFIIDNIELLDSQDIIINDFYKKQEQLLAEKNISKESFNARCLETYIKAHSSIKKYNTIKSINTSIECHTESIEAVESKIPLIESKEESTKNIKGYQKVNTPFSVPSYKREEYYTIKGNKVPFGLDIFNESFKKDGYVFDETDEYYKLQLLKNQVVLQILANQEIEEYAKELIDDLKKANKKLSNYGFSRIYYINSPKSIFHSLSRDYMDFKNSEAIKKNDYFEIILEYKKGDASKDYLDSFLDNQRSKYLEIGLLPDEFDSIVDNALCNWCLDINEVEVRSKDFAFFEDPIIEILFEKNVENIYMPKEEWFCNRITLDIEKDRLVFCGLEKKELYKKLYRTPYKDISALIKELKNEDNHNLQEFWLIEVFNIELKNHDDSMKNSLTYLTNRELIKYQEASSNISEVLYENLINYEKLVSRHYKYIFEYNKNVLESKKEIIIKELDKYLS